MDDIPTPPRNLTHDFFSTQIRSPSPPRTAARTHLAAVHASRIFPSRYTANDDDDQRTDLKKPRPDFLVLDLSPAFSDSSRVSQSHELSSLSSISTSSSSTHSSLALPDPTLSHSLPTPPPRSPGALTDTSNEPTPRQFHLEPAFTKSDEDPLCHLEPVSGAIITTNPPSILLPPDTVSSPTLTLTAPDFPLSADSSLPSTVLHLIRPLGQGAFSSVWLAEDKTRVPLALKSKKSIHELKRKASMANLSRNSSLRSTLSRDSSIEDKSKSLDASLRSRRFKAKVRGTRPVGFDTRYLDERHGEMGMSEFGILQQNYEEPSAVIGTPMSPNGEGATGVRRKITGPKKMRLVAVKMTPRNTMLHPMTRPSKRERLEEEERTRVGFIREVEVLKHISHPNITPLLEHLSTASHHILVLPYLPGGDLLGLVNNNIAWSKLGEAVLRRIWCELCKAVGWMHGVGLVHRDIKLENILLTTTTFSTLTPTSSPPTLSNLPIPPLPLIKLSDFGLSRFIEVDENREGELLSTRCGSEAYAAPELVMGTGSIRAQAQINRKNRDRDVVGHGDEDMKKNANNNRNNTNLDEDGVRGFYDARETDAWACGVVLYALVARKLPFGEGGHSEFEKEHHDKVVIGGDGVPGYTHGHGKRNGSVQERRQWLMRIARGEYEWPSSSPSSNHHVEGEEALVGESLIRSKGARRIVGRLLVRDPRKRARIMDLWDDEWMWGSGGGLMIGMTEEEWRERERVKEKEREREIVGLGIDFGVAEGVVDPNGYTITVDDYEKELPSEIDVDMHKFLDEGWRENEGNEDDGEEEEETEEHGWLLDQEGIGSVARQEVI